ncbi:LysM peptidoglycan-binding domain-containing protein [uncultured Lacinutrix sp.]|uniref:PBP1 and LysM peptidoglycan-binding domain-containing protein n=1 Tax=uncultured Lacinutrix sp. TaxID=574032 RepID=UPI00262BB267|nr:LysM peptidoglycan-binding domain-containing protein [uncultured Lacinutrix sp.]
MKKIIYLFTLVMFFGCSAAKAQNYVTHKVKSGETIETIAEKYKVTKEHIHKLNPDAKKGIKQDAVLIIMKTGGVRPVRGGVKQPPKKKVTEIKELTGYKKHKVKRKETLYSLSKKYGVTEAEIKKYNTFLYSNNLRKGDRLQIPVFEIKKVEEKSTTTTYTVLPKEGKWRIAYKYGITVLELEELNPGLAEVLQPGQVITVPNLEDNSIKQVDEQYSYYTVLPKEGFFRLKIKTGLEQSDLERLNPGLSTSGLKEGMVLKVPYGAIETESGVETVVDTTTSSVINLSTAIKDRETKNIVVMLPFALNKVNIDSVVDTKQKIKNNRTLGLTLDFYSGVLMAFDSLKKMGVNLKVDVYDTQNRESEVNAIIRTKDFTTTDVVIGPLLPKNFNTVAFALEGENVPMVSPVTRKVNIGNNVFQSRPDAKVMETKIVDYFVADTTAQVIIISDSKRKVTSAMLKTKFPKAAMVSSRLDKKTKKDQYYILEQDLLDVIKPGNNVVFLETDNSSFVSSVSSMLNALLIDGTDIVLTTTSQNKAFENEEVSNYHLSNLHFTYPSISKIVSEDSNNSFVKMYKKQHKTSPNAYAIRGFDLTMDVVLRLVTSGNLYNSVIDTPFTSYVENKFSYKKKMSGGYYNDSVYIVRYNDLKIEEIKQ